MSKSVKRVNGSLRNNSKELHTLVETHIKPTELTFSFSKRYPGKCRPIPVISCEKPHLQLPAGVILIRQKKDSVLELIPWVSQRKKKKKKKKKTFKRKMLRIDIRCSDTLLK